MSTACNVQPKKSKSIFERPPLATVYYDRAFRTAHGLAGSVVTAAQVWGYEKAVAAKNELSFLIRQETLAFLCKNLLMSHRELHGRFDCICVTSPNHLTYNVYDAISWPKTLVWGSGRDATR